MNIAFGVQADVGSDARSPFKIQESSYFCFLDASDSHRVRLKVLVDVSEHSHVQTATIKPIEDFK